MKSIIRNIIELTVIVSLLWGIQSVYSASVLFPYQGGTGTSTVPSAGQVLVGQSNGIYAPQATSTLGLGGGSGSVSTSSPITQFHFPYWANTTGGLSGTSTLVFTNGVIEIRNVASSTELRSPSSTVNTLTIGTLNGLLKGTTGLVGIGANGTDFTLITASVCSSGQHVSQISATGTVTCSADAPSSTIPSLPVSIANGGTATSGTPTTNALIYFDGTFIRSTSSIPFNAAGTGLTGTYNSIALSTPVVVTSGGTNNNAAPTANQIIFYDGTRYSGTSTIPFSVAGTGLTGTYQSLALTVPVAISSGGIATTTTPNQETLLMGNGTNFDLRKLTAGTNITIATTSNSVTINSTASGGGGTANNQYAYVMGADNATLPDVDFATPNRVSSGTINLSYLDFPNATGSSAMWSIPVPKYLSFATSNLDIFYTSTSTATGTVSWEFDWNALATSSLLAGNSTFTNIKSVTSTYNTSTAMVMYGESIALSSSTFYVGGNTPDVVLMKIYRRGLSDTLAADAQFIKAVLRFW